MKRTILFLSLVTGFQALCQNQPTERQLIENTIQLYFEGWATGDTAKLGKAMHASCFLKNYRDGKFTSFSKSQYLGLFKPHARTKNLSTNIVSLDITNNMGSAKVEIINEREVFTDYFNLMKTTEGWKIADKVSTRTPHKTNDVLPQKEIVLDGLKRPWSMAFLSEDEVLISEKEGDLIKYNFQSKEKTRIKGFPSDLEDGLNGFGDNTGKFDVLIDPDFKSNRYIYLSYAAKAQNGRTTKIVRAVLENASLQQIKVLFVAEPYADQRVHYGGGMLFGTDGKLYFTIGERIFTEKDEPSIPIAQNVEDKRGKIYRINSDGTIPNDNPDFGDKAIPGLYATGIRAAQGLTRDLHTGKIWFSEHGTHQGDEINVLKAGANYGWPMKTTGKYRFAEYAPAPIRGNKYTEPVWSWMQTVAPTGLHVYWGTEFAAWNHNLLVGGLSKGSLWRLVMAGETVKSAEELFTDDRLRIRKVIQSPMGKLYLLSDEVNGKLIRVKNTGF
ncbi:PQQ-dependent sugar dehydrogenase [Dyadobacter subterraneus]|uniref:PQQ-dependent sugar dehydrogenase n=1 Tax=Dyadobacter subterraneus TaxID=2773304 RepID=A0ABR9WDT6_9BACT|nr:PQQ-dependent sugar dehydrogenase [Dyadobacter subterraneus]MBE9463662.1 PQQ-dependent sugar dehydrogenase [Dyadobacter subterraneus]